MNDSRLLAAKLLETSAVAYASAAYALLQEPSGSGPGIARNSAAWKAHLKQRILELAAAIRVGRPDMFVRRISWLRRAVKARDADEADIRAALASLRRALEREFPEQLMPAVEQPIHLALEMLEQDIEQEAGALDGSTPLGALGLKYLAACLEARSADAVALILDALDGGVTPQEAYIEVLLPAQRETGQLWHRGDVSVAEERLVSDTTRELMTLIVNKYAKKADPQHTLLAASVAGNAHDIGLRAVADLFRLAGWRAIFLGADMPTPDIAQAIQSFTPSLVVLSATLTTQISELANAIERIKQLADPPPVLVGGLALEDSDGLWKQLGADAYAPTVASALTIGSELVAQSGE